MAIGLFDPPASLGVLGQGLGVDPLGGEHRDTRRVGAKARAVLADVRVGAGSLSRSPQAVATGKAGLDGGLVAPVAIGAQRDPPLVVGQRPDAGLGEFECSFVFGAHGLVEEPPITQAHLGRDVTRGAP